MTARRALILAAVLAVMAAGFAAFLVMYQGPAAGAATQPPPAHWLTLAAAAPLVAAAERERLADLGDELDLGDAIRQVVADAVAAERERIRAALPAITDTLVRPAFGTSHADGYRVVHVAALLAVVEGTNPATPGGTP